MAFDQSTRNRVQKFVAESRAILTEEFTRQLQSTYGMDPKTGTIADPETLTFLDNQGQQTALILRETLTHYQATIPGKSQKTRTCQALDRIIREQAFTVLNRLSALRMAGARGFLIESIANGYSSKGFQLYKNLAGTALGKTEQTVTGDTYRQYLFSLFDEFSGELPVLFDRYSIQGRLFPRESALLALLEQINHFEIEHLWAEDETIGWIYQYFNSKKERKTMRDESSAPRNSRELAVRNQFFTPRYVVEFLTDNTLGRIWYEMTQGKTSLVDTCRYLVRRPNEIFLAEGEDAPDTDAEAHESLSQEELLKQPVYIPFRVLKDPRNIRMLDPACGSMHFGLYAYDLFEHIYEEAWQLETELGPNKLERPKEFKPLQDSFANFVEFQKAIPKMIIEHNIHGVDIDPRAVQIAGLSLWQRAHRTWHQMGVKPGDRPMIRKSNIVCAEPMPGDKKILKEFTSKLHPPVLGQLVETIFDKMELAGEAGTLLKIEDEIASTISRAKDEFNKEILKSKEEKGFLPGMAPKREPTLFDFAELPDDTNFWDTAEKQILNALENYADQAESDNGQRRLFAEDAAKGFAFIDLCRKRFDVVLMNPPFGEMTTKARPFLLKSYPKSAVDIYCSFIERSKGVLSSGGFTGIICPRSFLYYIDFKQFREQIIFSEYKLFLSVELGFGVLDTATVRTTINVFRNESSNYLHDPVYAANLSGSLKKEVELLTSCSKSKQLIARNLSEFIEIPGSPVLFSLTSGFTYYLSKKLKLDPIAGKFHTGERIGASILVNGLQTNNDFRFIRVFSEVPSESINSHWKSLFKQVMYMPFENAQEILVNWERNGREIKAFIEGGGNSASRYVSGQDYYGFSGFWFPGICERGLCSAVSRFNGIPSRRGLLGVSKNQVKYSSEYLCGVMNSIVGTGIVAMIMPDRYRNPTYVGMIPIPTDSNQKSKIKFIVQKIRGLLKEIIWDEINPDFRIHPFFSYKCPELFFSKNIERFIEEVFDIITNISELERKIDQLTATGLGIDEKDIDILKSFSNRPSVADWDHFKILEEKFLINSIIQYLVGVAFQRWKTDISEIKEPGADGECIPNTILGQRRQDKSIEILSGDDFGFFSIITATAKALNIFQEERTIERDINQFTHDGLLKYFRNINSGFFDFHYKYYNRNKRAVPIYWPLQTPSGFYTLWVYYHRLTEQTLYICVNDFVEPKLKTVTDDLNNLRNQSARNSTEEKELAKLTDLETELKDFRDEVLRIAKFWKPNLNDGVQITAAPLWKLFQHRQWQKKLKQTWEKLEKGDYDWTHLACSIWPERVLKKCHSDRSLAIAHDVENDLWEEVEVPVIRRGKDTGKTKWEWQPRQLSETQLQDLIRQILETGH